MRRMIASFLALVFLAGMAVQVQVVQAGDAKMGRKVYKKCVRCHGRDGKEVEKAGGKAIAGMSAAEIVEKLQGYADGTYGGEKKKQMMKLVKRLSTKEMEAVGAYIETEFTE